MLKSIFKGTAALAVAATFTAGAAHATEHVVFIAEGSYFPSVVYVSEGDLITFKNESQSAHTVTGEDDAWTSGAIPPPGEFTLEVTESTPATFSGQSGGGVVAEGEIVFQ